MRDASANVRPGPGVIVQKYSSFYKALIVKYFSQDLFLQIQRAVLSRVTWKRLILQE